MAKLLLVEDDNNLREIYQARLSAEGYDIVAAQNGEEALSVAKQHRPDLIISDVMMPRISGFEMLDILRTTPELANTKVIMLTALGQAEDQARADKLGADKYLVKSQVTLEDIVNCARDLLNGTTVVTPNPDQTTTATASATATAVSATAGMSTASPTVDQPIAPVSTQDADPNPIPHLLRQRSHIQQPSQHLAQIPH
ncbi:response regulator [Candidatus Saccharibacteria bacterium]|nr:MAG: response regulator [Candidatus Saccharibacteria bacterium]